MDVQRFYWCAAQQTAIYLTSALNQRVCVACVHVYTPVGRTALVCIHGIRIDFTLPLPSSPPFFNPSVSFSNLTFLLKIYFPHFVIFRCIHLSPFARLSSYFLSFDFTLNIYCSNNSPFSLAVLLLFNLPSNLSL